MICHADRTCCFNGTNKYDTHFAMSNARQPHKSKYAHMMSINTTHMPTTHIARPTNVVLFKWSIWSTHCCVCQRNDHDKFEFYDESTYLAHLRCALAYTLTLFIYKHTCCLKLHKHICYWQLCIHIGDTCTCMFSLHKSNHTHISHMASTNVIHTLTTHALQITHHSLIDGLNEYIFS